MPITNKRIHRVESNGARIWQRAFEAAARARLKRDIALLVKEVNQLDGNDLQVHDAMEQTREPVVLN